MSTVSPRGSDRTGAKVSWWTVVLSFIALVVVGMIAYEYAMLHRDNSRKMVPALYPPLVCVGDSHTVFGFQAGWAARMKHDRNMIEVAATGANTQQMLTRDYKAPTESWELLIFLGSNDAVVDSAARRGERVGLDLDAYRRNIVQLVGNGRNKNASRVLIVTPPPVRPDKYNAVMGRVTVDAKRVATFADAIREIAKERDYCTVVDLHKALSDHPQRYIRDDGIHLNGEGEDVLYQLIIDAEGTQPKEQ